MNEIKITVDGKEMRAQAGEMLIGVTDRNGCYIPRFCYHEKLSVAANCRMCLVEVARAPKPLPACATPVMDGMEVHTRSKLALQAQKDTMEFLLINHPLDCPVCDQGGECPLQDQAMGYGKDASAFTERKRAVQSYDIGPLVATEMTRCIHCTRCVRFGEEVAGVMEMGAPGRGENMLIATFLNQSIDSEVSGNIIDLCPVGALTSRPYRFAARSWELQNHAGVSPHDCVGANINIQTLRDRIERVLPIENAHVNECWLADRDRFSYEAVNSENRLTQPMRKVDGEWVCVEWEEAFHFVAAGLQSALSLGSLSAIGGLAASTSTLEEFYLLQKLLRSLGSENIDHRLQQCDFRDDAPRFDNRISAAAHAQPSATPGSEIPLSAYNSLESVLLVGANIRKEQPLIALRLRQSWLAHGCKIHAINPMDFDLNFGLCSNQIVPNTQLVATLGAVAVSVAAVKQLALPDEIKAYANLGDGSQQAEIAEHLCSTAERRLIILGAWAQQHADASVIKMITRWIAQASGCAVAVLAPGNSVAGAVAQCRPGINGKNTHEMFREHLAAYILLGTEAELDCLEGKAARRALHAADFVVQISAFKSESVMQYADVLLPMAAFAESAGTYINCEGRVQAGYAAANPQGESRPAWKILRVMGNFLNCSGFDYVTLADVTACALTNAGQGEFAQAVTSANIQISNSAEAAGIRRAETAYDNEGANRGDLDLSADHDVSAKLAVGLVRIQDIPMYRGDNILRNAAALQQTADNPCPQVVVNPACAESLGLHDGDTARVTEMAGENGVGEITLMVKLSARIPDGCAYIPAGFLETLEIAPHCQVTLAKLELA